MPRLAKLPVSRIARPARPQRSTRQLDATLRALWADARHPTAERVYQAVRAEMPSVSRGTVYRNLHKLLDLGQARLVHVGERAARYDGRLDGHDHFACTRCGLVVDVEQGGGRRESVRGRVAGHRVEGRTLTYFGTCRGCEASVAEGRARAAARGRVSG